VSEHESSLGASAGTWIYPTLIHGVLALTFVTRLTDAGPRWDRFYDDWKLVRPAATDAFAAAGTWMEGRFIAVLAVLAAMLAADGLVLWLLGGWRRWEGATWFYVIIGLLLIIWGLMEVSFLVPYYKLQRALSR
jgi:hypothetical protein